MGKFHQGIDWQYGVIYNDATLTGGKDTYIQGVTLLTSTNGTAAGTASNPLVVNTAAGGAGVTVTDRSITNMSGASQSVLTAGQGNGLIYMQALAGNVGTIWINLAGGTAVVGSGVPLLPGGYVTIQPGIANAITGIAATANDDLTVYAG